MLRPMGQHKRVWVALVGVTLVISAGCGSHETKTNAQLATKACQSFLAATVTTGGILSPAGQPQNQDPSQKLNAALSDSKASGDTSLYNAMKKASPAVTGAYNPSSVTQAQFNEAMARMNDVGGLCGPFGVTFPQIGA
jgi:hypothetical protein